MSFAYFKVYKDFISIAQELDNGARGRLFLALLEYINDEEPTTLSGGEKIAFLTMKAQIDRDADSYNDVCEKRKKAGEKGAQARWSQKSEAEKMANAILPYSKNDKHGKEEEKEEEKDKDKDEDNNKELLLNAREESELKIAFSEYQRLLGNFLSTSASEELIGYFRELGNEVCLHALETAQDNGVIKWAYIRAILQNYRNSGVKSLEDAKRLDAQRQDGKPAEYGLRGKNAPPSCKFDKPIDLEALKAKMEEL